MYEPPRFKAGAPARACSSYESQSPIGLTRLVAAAAADDATVADDEDEPDDDVRSLELPYLHASNRGPAHSVTSARR